MFLKICLNIVVVQFPSGLFFFFFHFFESFIIQCFFLNSKLKASFADMKEELRCVGAGGSGTKISFPQIMSV